MKTRILKKTGKHILRALLLVISICCINSASAQYTASITPSYGANGFVTFSGSSNVPTNWYRIMSWNFGDGNSTGWRNDSSATHMYLNNGTYTVYLSVYDSNGSNMYTAYDSLQVTVTNAGQCTVNYTDSVTSSGTATFYATSTGGTPTYTWYFGDGSNSQVTNTNTVTHAYATSGYYNVKVVLNDSSSNGWCNAVDSMWVNVNGYVNYSNPCTLSSDFTWTNGSSGQVNFTSTSTNVTPSTIYYWYPGTYSPLNGWVSTTGTSLNNYSYTYQYNGSYFAELDLYDTISGCFDWNWYIVTVTGGANCNYIASFKDTIAAQANVTFTSTSTNTGPNTIYTWDPGDGSGPQWGGSTFNYQYYYNGTYNVQLSITDSTGYCTSVDSASITISNADSCLQSVWMDSTSVVMYTYTDSLNPTVTDTGYYTMYYFYSVSDTACSNRVINPNARTMGAAGSNVVYMWNFGDGSKETGMNVSRATHHYPKAGDYTPSLTIKYAGAIKGSRSVKHLSASPLGIESLNVSSGSFDVYPNPSNGQFKLTLSNIKQDQNVNISVTNVLGEVIYQTTSPTSGGKLVQDINLQNASTGMYFVKATTSNKVFTSKLVINK